MVDYIIILFIIIAFIFIFMLLGFLLGFFYAMEIIPIRRKKHNGKNNSDES